MLYIWAQSFLYKLIEVLLADSFALILTAVWWLLFWAFHLLSCPKEDSSGNTASGKREALSCSLHPCLDLALSSTPAPAWRWSRQTGLCRVRKLRELQENTNISTVFPSQDSGGRRLGEGLVSRNWVSGLGHLQDPMRGLSCSHDAHALHTERETEAHWRDLVWGLTSSPAFPQHVTLVLSLKSHQGPGV